MAGVADFATRITGIAAGLTATAALLLVASPRWLAADDLPPTTAVVADLGRWAEAAGRSLIGLLQWLAEWLDAATAGPLG